MFRSVSVAVGVVDALPGRLSKHTPHLHECRSWAGVDKQPSPRDTKTIHRGDVQCGLSFLFFFCSSPDLEHCPSLVSPRGVVVIFSHIDVLGGPRGVKFSASNQCRHHGTAVASIGNSGNAAHLLRSADAIGSQNHCSRPRRPQSSDSTRFVPGSDSACDSGALNLGGGKIATVGNSGCPALPRPPVLRLSR